MNNMIDENGNVTYYVVKVNGQIVSARYSTPAQAEAMFEHLSEAHRMIAEVVPVTAEGKEILLG